MNDAKASRADLVSGNKGNVLLLSRTQASPHQSSRDYAQISPKSLPAFLSLFINVTFRPVLMNGGLVGGHGHGTQDKSHAMPNLFIIFIL